ncbi:MAG: hypothetical protein JJV97_05930 [SAR324 cluster bacterium]|nr:hypothetical protein [SAR324 cluster bacterium]
MLLECNSCKARYKLADSIISDHPRKAEQSLFVHCTKCHEKIHIDIPTKHPPLVEVFCPHCHSEYGVDRARFHNPNLKVKCFLCKKLFMVSIHGTFPSDKNYLVTKVAQQNLAAATINKDTLITNQGDDLENLIDSSANIQENQELTEDKLSTTELTKDEQLTKNNTETSSDEQILFTSKSDTDLSSLDVDDDDIVVVDDNNEDDGNDGNDVELSLTDRNLEDFADDESLVANEKLDIAANGSISEEKEASSDQTDTKEAEFASGFSSLNESDWNNHTLYDADDLAENPSSNKIHKSKGVELKRDNFATDALPEIKEDSSPSEKIDKADQDYFNATRVDNVSFEKIKTIGSISAKKKYLIFKKPQINDSNDTQTGDGAMGSVSSVDDLLRANLFKQSADKNAISARGLSDIAVDNNTKFWFYFLSFSLISLLVFIGLILPFIT